MRKGLKQHSRVQESILAEFVAKGLLGMRMQGVARDFYFILTCINERNGTKDWGLTRRDGTVKPAYAALATYMRQLGRARLEGEIKSGDGIRTYLFTQPDGAQTILAWAVSSLDTVAGEIDQSHLPDCAQPCLGHCSQGKRIENCYFKGWSLEKMEEKYRILRRNA